MKHEKSGVIAAGHPETARAARAILEEGGNAWDAAVAAFFASCVAEPVLSSPGGGGFMLARNRDGQHYLFDFFVQTPGLKRKSGIEFYPITGNFGDDVQEFHIGAGSVATPGNIRGMFAIHRRLCTMPMGELIVPAAEMARQGVSMNPFQAYILQIISPIYLATPESRALFGCPTGDPLIASGEVFRNPDYALLLESLAREGEDLFYRGDVARMITGLMAEHGGHLTDADLSGYELNMREPLEVSFAGNRMLTNPPPSSGGTLIAFVLSLLEALPDQAGSVSTEMYPNEAVDHAQIMAEKGVWPGLLAALLEATDQARIEDASAGVNGQPTGRLLEPELLQRYRDDIRGNPRFSRGTTHISIIDGEGNMASLSTSNGEGCGLIVPGAGFMLNNMLGEEDLNPKGFGSWACNRRMTSMMAPTLLLFGDGREAVLGSGGSNRIRSAILQVILNLTIRGMSAKDAVEAPRIHFENGRLSVEGGFDEEAISRLVSHYPDHMVWSDRNLYFGGVHLAGRSPEGFFGAGDPRRGGVVEVL